jgi:imidazolonepropionase-like amidohydrolase
MFSAIPPGPDDPATLGFFVPAFLSHGIVGVRSMYDDLGAIRNVRAAFPDFDVVASGPILDGDPPYVPGSIVCKNAGEAREAVRKVKRDGANFVKVYSLLSRDVYFAISAEAKAADLPFAGHLPNSVSAVEASDAGQKSFEHLMGVPDDPVVFARFVKNGTWQTPTLTALRTVARAGDASLETDPRLTSVPDPIHRFWKTLITGMTNGKDMPTRRKEFEQQLRIVGAMHRAGVKILAGTDTPNPYVFPGSGLHDELELLVKAGLTPAEALQCATVRPAEYLGRLDHAGTIAVGKDADLVLLAADPLANIGNTRKIEAVILKGKLR